MENQKYRLQIIFGVILTSLMLVFICIQPISAEEEAVAISSISKLNGGFLIELTNTGEGLVRGILFNVSVTGGWINPIDYQYSTLLFACNCSDVFEPGNSYEFSTQSNETFSSFGILDLTVEISSYTIGTIREERYALIIGSFIILF